jgi:hypothetical protein
MISETMIVTARPLAGHHLPFTDQARVAAGPATWLSRFLITSVAGNPDAQLCGVRLIRWARTLGATPLTSSGVT